jgi:hypothetical protein
MGQFLVNDNFLLLNSILNLVQMPIYVFLNFLNQDLFIYFDVIINQVRSVLHII